MLGTILNTAEIGLVQFIILIAVLGGNIFFYRIYRQSSEQKIQEIDLLKTNIKLLEGQQDREIQVLKTNMALLEAQRKEDQTSIEDQKRSLSILRDAEAAKRSGNEYIENALWSLRSSNNLYSKLDAVSELGGDIAKRNPAVINELASSIDGAPLGLRWHIFTALSRIDALDVIYEKGLNDSDPTLQAHCIHLLGRKGYRKGQHDFVEKSKSAYHCVRVYARCALNSLHVQQPQEPADDEGNSTIAAFVLLKASHVEPNTAHNELTALRCNPTCGVVECAFVAGDYEFLIKVIAQNMEDMDRLIMRKIQGLSWVKYTRTFLIATEPSMLQWTKEGCQEKIGVDGVYPAYVFINTPALYTSGVIATLKGIQGIAGAWSIYGEHDVVVKVTGDNSKERDRTIVEELRRIPSVVSTKSYLALATQDKYAYWAASDKYQIDCNACLIFGECNRKRKIAKQSNTA